MGHTSSPPAKLKRKDREEQVWARLRARWALTPLLVGCGHLGNTSVPTPPSHGSTQDTQGKRTHEFPIDSCWNIHSSSYDDSPRLEASLIPTVDTLALVRTRTHGTTWTPGDGGSGPVFRRGQKTPPRHLGTGRVCWAPGTLFLLTWALH